MILPTHYLRGHVARRPRNIGKVLGFQIFGYP